MTLNYIDWTGGEQPIPNLTHVHLKFRNSHYDDEANLYWSQEMDWLHDDGDQTEFDIIAYAVAKEQPVFLSWTGGENPAPDELVEVIFRSDENEVLEAPSDIFDWTHNPEDPENDVIRYRIIEIDV